MLIVCSDCDALVDDSSLIVCLRCGLKMHMISMMMMGLLPSNVDGSYC